MITFNNIQIFLPSNWMICTLKCFLFVILNFFTIEFVKAQVNEKEYTSIEDALKEPNKVHRLNLSNQKNHDYFKDLSKFKNLEYLNLRNTEIKAPEDLRYRS